MLHLTKLLRKSNIRRFSGSANSRIEDEGDWIYSTEWWTRKDDSRTVYSQVSDKGNGVVSVVAHPCSKPDIGYWRRMEEWLRQRYAQIYPGDRRNEGFKVAGYQWRTLHFDDDTRESTAKVMAAYKESDPDSLYLMQQAHCIAVPYVKSMISTGLTTLAYCNFDLHNAILGVKKMKVLCIGHGGGSIPLFLASKFLGAEVHSVDIDPAVISASIEAMGFPSVSIVKTSGQRVCSEKQLFDELFWKGVRERLILYELDAEEFIIQDKNLYDIVFIDAYDADDIFPRKLWDPNSPFLKALSKKVHPKHGTVVVNLHADKDSDFDPSLNTLPMGRYVTEIARAFKHMLIDSHHSHNRCPGLAYTVHAPWVSNTSLVVSRCFDNLIGSSENIILNSLLSRSLQVDNMLKMPFSCLPYFKNGFTIVE